MIKSLLISFICGTAAAGVVSAQPIPKLAALSREWFQRGTTQELVLSGENLGDAQSVHVSGEPGLSVTIIRPDPGKPAIKVESSAGGISVGNAAETKSVRAQVVVGEDASLNARELRVVTSAGVSNPLRGYVSSLKEVLELGTSGTPQRLELPVGVSGTISAPGEQDTFEFHGQKGQELIMDVLAFRAGSPLDSSLVVLNSAGKELARSEDAKGFDSFLHFAVPDDGDYTVQLRDFRYEGSAAHKYHLTVGSIPYVETAFPAGGRRGKPVEVALQGYNLGGVASLPLSPAADAPLGWQEVRFQTEKGLSTPFRFDVSDLDEYLEAEPNNGTNQANSVSVPGVINGRIGAARDVDCFKFKSGKAQTLICEVTAQRLGSPLDAVLTLRDATGKVLQENDDAEGSDARIEFALAKDTEYTLALRDLLDRGGDSFVYRLAIQPPEPGLSVRFSPDVPRIQCGGRTIVRCELTRKAGFGGPVLIQCEGLPVGVTAEPLLLTPEEPGNGYLILTADESAVAGVHSFKVSAQGVIDGNRLVRVGEPLVGEAAAREAMLTVLARPAPFTSELLTLSLMLEQEQSGALDIVVIRRDGFDGEIKLTAEGYSAGREPLSRNVEFQPVTLKGAESRGRLLLKAKPDAEIGSRLVFVKAEATVDGQAVSEYSQAIPLEIKQLPFTILSTMKRLSVAVLPGGLKSPASEAEFAIRASRRGWFTDQIQLDVEGVPEGVTISSTNLPSHVAEASFKLTATEKAPAGKEFQLTVVGSANVAGRSYQQRTGPITLSVTKSTDIADTK